MSWSAPFLELVQSQSASVREAYDAASLEITNIINLLDELSDQEAGSPDDIAKRCRKLERAIRDIRWSTFEGLEVAQLASRRILLRNRRESVQRCTQRIADANSSGRLDRSRAATAAAELLKLRRNFTEEKHRSLVTLSRWTPANRSG